MWRRLWRDRMGNRRNLVVIPECPLSIMPTQLLLIMSYLLWLVQKFALFCTMSFQDQSALQVLHILGR